MMEQLVGCGFVLVQMTFLHLQDIVYPSTNANFYKFGISPPGSTSYYDPTHIYEVHDNGLGMKNMEGPWRILLQRLMNRLPE
jgi:E3 ubiquitin-protein ligase BIG BROTHER-like protein